MPETGQPAPDGATSYKTYSTAEGTTITSQLPYGATTDSDRQISGEIMDAKSICVLGRGACPTECPLFETGEEVYEKIPIGADITQIRARLRREVIFGDAFTHEANVKDIGNVMGACLLENL